MKHQWLAYVIVGLLSVGAGVAIAGLPDNVPVDATIVPLATTDVPPPTVSETTAAASTVPDTTEPQDTAPETTEPETTEPETTEPETTEPETTELDNAGLPDRSELVVVVANGANVAGTALRLAAVLEDLGYADVLALNGSEIVEFTTIYFADGFEEAAVRLAEDLDLLADFAVPIADSPNVAELPAGVELLAYIGIDRA